MIHKTKRTNQLGKGWAQRTQGSHAIAKGMARGRDETFGTRVSSAVEFVMTPLVTMEAGGPVVDMGIWEWFIVWGESKVWGHGGMRVVRNMEVGRKGRAFHPKVIEESINLGDSCVQA